MAGRGPLAALAAALVLAWAPQAVAAGPFADWAAVVVAGDFHASDGKPTEAFDNARRDVSQALQRAGFQAANIRQFSVRPERYSNPRPLKSDGRLIYDQLTDLAAKAPGGCLFYVTSHGAPQGVQMGQGILPPAIVREIIDRACGTRPTVAVISACFSGVFVPELAAPHRMVITAARRDRTSFGCGVDNKYPFFDECFLQAIAQTRTFPALAAAAGTCVAEREVKEGMKPPSQPQVWIGPGIRPMLPLFTFGQGPPA